MENGNSFYKVLSAPNATPVPQLILLQAFVYAYFTHASGYLRPVRGRYPRDENPIFSLSGGCWVRQRCRVSCVTGASIWYWFTVGQGLLFLQQVRIDGECFYFFCSFTFIHFSFSPVPFFHSSTISLPFSGRRYKMAHKGWCVVKLQLNFSLSK